MRKTFLIIASLAFGLAGMSAKAQMSPAPTDPHQQPGVTTPGTPPTFPTDRQETKRERQNRQDSDADSQSTTGDRQPQSDQYPQRTDRDDQNQQESDRDYDRDRNNGSIGSNAGQQDNERKDDLDRGMNPDRDHGSDYQSQLQKAMQQNSNLAGVQVAYTDTTVELTGTVPTGKEKHEARMMAHDYANGRKVVDHIKVTGKEQ
jgi:hypothetical protein